VGRRCAVSMSWCDTTTTVVVVVVNVNVVE
jgi:hypothetical protein